MSPLHDNSRPSVRPSVAKQVKHAAPGAGASEDAPLSNEKTLVSRRRFLYGAVGVGAVAALGIGAAVYSSAGGGADSTISSLNVSKSSLVTLNDFEALENPDEHVEKVAEIDLPYGTLVWASDESVAACLLPTESGSPLAQIGLVFLGSGSYDTVLEKAVGTQEGFEVYDVRANGRGLVWTEANILQGTWRIYAATISDGTIGKPLLLEEGNGAYDTPTIAVAGNRALWLANPKEPEDAATEMPHARLMGATFGKTDGSVLLESSRRMGTPPYAYNDTVTIAPRVDSPSLYYELTNLDATTGEVRDTVILPHSITPIEAGYGETGFMFSFPEIYDFDGGISNLGTYTPLLRPADGDYNAAEWFDFTRTPTAAPAWCNNLLIVKSTYAVCGVNLNSKSYFAIDVENGADTYGEYLASTGSGDNFVTYTNIDHTPIGESRIHACRVKVWRPIAQSAVSASN